MKNGMYLSSLIRHVACVLSLASITASSLRAQPTPPAVAADWSRIVPGDARFYVEMRDLAEIRALWQGLGIWQTVRELTERDTHPTSQPWQRRTEELLGLGPEDAISRLLGHRSALIASESSHWNGGVVLAELQSAPDLEPLLKDWDAKQLADEGPVKRYQLGGGILLAVLDQTLVLGPADDPDGLWGRTVLLLAGRRGPSLAARSDYSALRSRLSANPQGLLYAAWRRDDSAAFNGCTRLLAAAQVSPSEINCELHGQRPAARVDEHPLVVSDLAALPAATLAVWAGPVDLEDLIRRRDEGRFGAPETLVGFFLEPLAAGQSAADSPIAQLGPTGQLVIALDPAAADLEFNLPAFTLIVKTKKRGALVDHLDGLFGILAAVLQYMTAEPDQTQPENAVKRKNCEDVDLHSVEIGPSLERKLKLPFLSKVEVAWAYFDDALLLSTSRMHAEQIIRARRRKAPRLDDSPDAAGMLPPTGGRDDLAECLYLRGSDLSSMLANWLDYLGKHQPQALGPEWWQTWAGDQLHQRDKLGIALQADPANPRRALVAEVEDGSPAAGQLHAGDRITGAAGAPLASSQPAQEAARRYQERGNAAEFTFEVIRNEKTIRVTIPVSPAPANGLANFDPVRALRQIATLSRHADAVAIWRFVARKDRFDARVRVRWQPPKH